jgi:hypothetical protein
MASVLLNRSADRRFFAGIALLLLVYVLLGFWPSYIAAGFVFAPLPSILVHVHAILYVGWIALFGIQIGLIGTHRVAAHRKLGTLLGWWAAAMLLVGPATVVMAVRRPKSDLGALVFGGDLAQTIAFAVLVAAGLAQRRQAPQHKRFMMLASAVIIAPALARWPFDFIQNGPPFAFDFFYLLPALLLVAFDLLTLRRVQRASWIGLGIMLLVLASFSVLPEWQLWKDFTNWVVHF